MRPMSDLHRTTQTKQQRQKAVNNPIKPLSKINTQYDIKIDRDEFPHWLHSFIYSCIYLSTDLLLLLFLVRNELAEWLQRCHFSNFDLAITWFAYHQLLHFPGKKRQKWTCWLHRRSLPTKPLGNQQKIIYSPAAALMAIFHGYVTSFQETRTFPPQNSNSNNSNQTG